jgi:hypothetical protein
MKTHFLIGAIFNTFLWGSVCYAQKMHLTSEQVLALQKEDIKNTPYIFEGKVIQEVKSGEQLTCSVIQITKIYRGNPQIKLGTIKVITEQNINTKDGDPGLSQGSYIIFGRTDNTNTFSSVAADNTITISLADISVAIFDRGYNRSTARWGPAKYNSIDSLYSFFRTNGLTVQEEVSKADSTKH